MSSRRAHRATFAPSRAMTSADALPMPSLPPVTMAIFPVSPRSMATSFAGKDCSAGGRPALLAIGDASEVLVLVAPHGLQERGQIVGVLFFLGQDLFHEAPAGGVLVAEI